MSEIARTDDLHVVDESSHGSRPHLAVVRGDPAPTPGLQGDDQEPNAGRWGMIGYAIGFATVFIGITVAGTLAGFGFGNALGLGAFVAVWGGGGFGFMLGATIPLARHLDAQHVRPATHPSRGDHPHDPATR